MDDVSTQSGFVAIVTGSNRGIGYEVALEMVKKEITVVMACRQLAP